MASYELFKPILAKTEGYFARLQNDTGGMTYRGIARNFHPNWPGWTIIDFQLAMNPGATDGQMSQKLRNIAYLDQLVHDFYQPLWNEIGAPGLNQDLANLYMDWYIHKPADAVKGVQGILNQKYGERLTVDGVSGPKTRAALLRHASDQFYNDLVNARIDYYKSKQFSSPTFWQSWVSRVLRNFPLKSIPQNGFSNVALVGLGLIAGAFALKRLLVRGEHQDGGEGRAERLSPQ